MFNRIVFVGLFIHLFLFKSFGQTSPPEWPGTYYNNFSKYTHSKLNADSALFAAGKLASNKLAAGMLGDLMHNNFAQNIADRKFDLPADSARMKQFMRSKVFAKELLTKMITDTSKVLVNAIRPLYIYSKVQDAGEDAVALATLTKRFMTEELADADIYSNRAGRYGLLIYSTIKPIPTLKPLSEKLLQNVVSQLEKGQINAVQADTRAKSEERAWYRYLYAYANFLKAGEESNLPKKKTYLKNAFDYSPDLLDENNKSAYFYDMHIILGLEKLSFQDDYLDFLNTQTTDKESILPILLQITLTQPAHKEKLKTLYSQTKENTKDFNTYWMEQVNRHARDASPIALTMLDKTRFSNASGSGKWLLVDFWGTWCGPCRQEHPDMQKFYETTINKNSDRIALLTIACKDTEPKVTNYMSEKKLSFPVAMSDKKIESTYMVQGYPTKLLITPAGKYVIIPYGSDWMNFVKQYANL